MPVISSGVRLHQPETRGVAPGQRRMNDLELALPGNGNPHRLRAAINLWS